MSIDHLILPGRYEEAVRRCGKKDPGRVRHFLEATGVRDSIAAHLCLGRFVEAAAMADGLTARFPRAVSWDYMYAGLVRWFQRKCSEAAAVWKEGMKCGYTFHAGIDCALLLWYASVRSKRISGDAAIEQMNKPQLRGRRDKSFVDAIVRYIKDEIDEAEARRLAQNETWEHFIAANIAQLDFYVAAKAYSRGNRRAFQKHMAACASAEGLDQIFPELYLARYEAGMLPFQSPGKSGKTPSHPTKKVRRKRVES